jgi:SAM-dependent methyltransferase
MDIRASYDSAAEAYAEHLAAELEQKPLDRHLLNRFAEAVRGPIADLGCGPGQIARYLHEQGADVRGFDLSEQMIHVARKRNPGIEFRVGDMNRLELSDGALAGVIAFYAIVHLKPADLAGVLREIRRVVAADGLVLIAFHSGDEVIHVEELFGAKVSLDFQFFEPDEVVQACQSTGLKVIERVDREPYDGAEHPSRRCYLLARAV